MTLFSFLVVRFGGMGTYIGAGDWITFIPTFAGASAIDGYRTEVV
jgi:hypothetical protein